MNETEWLQLVRSQSSVLRKFDQVSLETFVVELIWSYEKNFLKPIDLQMVEWFLEEHQLKREECLHTLNDVVFVEMDQEENETKTEKHTTDDLCKSIRNVSQIQQNISSKHICDWLPVVKLTDGLKFVIKPVFVKLIDVLHPSQKKSSVKITVKSNFGVDETVVHVSKSILKAHPNILKKSVVNVDDVLLWKLYQVPMKDKFMSSLNLQHVDLASNFATNNDVTQNARFLRSSILSNVPWSSELGLLLRKPIDARPLTRIERNERFLNRPDTPTSIPFKSYPITYSKSSPDKYHMYRFGNRRSSTSCAKTIFGNSLIVNGNVLSNIKGYKFSLRDVRVVIKKEEEEAVRKHIMSISTK